MELPETRYAKTTDDVWIAYQTVGEGPIDLVVVNTWITHLESRHRAVSTRCVRRVVRTN